MLEPTVVEPAGPPLPRWGMGDIAIGFALLLSVPVLGIFVLLWLTGIDGFDPGEPTTRDAVVVLVVGLISIQAVEGLWPVFVAVRKGFGAVADFRFQFRLVDLAIGPAAAVAMLVGAAAVGAAVSWLVGEELGSDESTNTQILTDAKEYPILLGLILFGIVIGAPVVEELFFRGLCLRAIEKRWGLVAGVVGSTLLFVPLHYSGGGLGGTAVLFASISVVGGGLAAVVALTGRLGPAIVAHFFFNLTGAAVTLAV